MKLNKNALILACLSAISLAAGLYLSEVAFPGQTFDLKVTRGQAQERALSYLNERGYSVSDFEIVTGFESNASGLVYLQRSIGRSVIEDRAEIAPAIYYWKVRAFKPLQAEEYTVKIDPKSGDVVGFDHALSETAKGARLTREQAQTVAEKYLKDKHAIDLSQYELVTATDKKLSERTNYTFEWDKKNIDLADANLLVLATVSGAEVSSFGTTLQVPEKFIREYNEEASRGTLLTLISAALGIILFIAVFIVFIMRYKRGDLAWRFSLWFGIILFLLSIASSINAFSSYKMLYFTQLDYSVYWMTTIITIFLVALFYAVFALLSGSAGEALGRDVFPKSVEKFSQFFSRDFFSRRFAVWSLAGYALMCLHIGIVAVFYAIAITYFGVTYEEASPFDDMLDSQFPFLYPLFVGLTAAITEEFVYRLFGVSLCKKLFKNTFIALLIPAVFWAFAHSNYPIYPVYVRGIELTLIGLLYGYFFIRFHIWTTIVSHYTFNALLIGLPLLQSQNKYYVVSGALVLGLGLLPVIPSLYSLFKKPHELST